MGEVPSSPVRARVFVSYSRRDASFADWLAESLRDRGFEAFVDKHDIAPGEPWKERLAHLIASADTVTFVVSPDSVASPICGWEIEESARLGKKILPVVVRPVPDAAAPSALSRLNYIFADEPQHRAEAVQRLHKALETDLDWVREHTRLTEIADHWSKTGKPASQVLRGRDLEDAEQWLSHRPGQSSQPTDIQRDLIRASRRAARLRQRTWVGGSAAIAVLALGLAGFAEVSRQDAVHQRDAADAAKARAQTQQARAETALHTATDAANTLVYKLAQRLEDEVGMPVALVKDIVDPALALQDKLIASGETDVALKSSQSHALAVMAQTLLRLGQTEAARGSAQRSLVVVRGLRAADPDNRVLRQQLLESLSIVGDVQDRAGEIESALTTYREELATARDLFAGKPTDATKRETLAALHRIGALLDANKRGDEAFAFLEEAAPLARDLANRLGTPAAREDLVKTLQNLAAHEIRRGDNEHARVTMVEALGQARDLPRDLATLQTIASLQRNIVVTSINLQDYAGALASADDSVATARQVATDKDNRDTQALLANCLFVQGGLRVSRANSKEERQTAMSELDESVLISRAMAEDRANIEANVFFADRLTGVALALIQIRDPAHSSEDEALKDASEAVATLRRLRDDGHLSDAAAVKLKQAETLVARLSAPSEKTVEQTAAPQR